MTMVRRNPYYRDFIITLHRRDIYPIFLLKSRSLRILCRALTLVFAGDEQHSELLVIIPSPSSYLFSNKTSQLNIWKFNPPEYTRATMY